jgi:hypothetical protein
MSMSGIMGFPGIDFRRNNRSFDDSYSSGSESHGRDSRRQRRQFTEFMQRQAYMHARGGQQSPFGGMGGCHSPFMGRGGQRPMMGGFAPPGFASPSGMGMGMGMGPGMGRGPPMGMGMMPGMGMNMGMGMGGGLGRGMGHMGRSPFLGGPPMGYRQASPFGLGNSHRSPSISPGRHSHRGQTPWPQTRRSPFSSSLFDDDEDDESDYDTSSMYGFPRRRREGFGRHRRSPYQSRGTPGWIHGFSDGYEEYSDLDDDSEDESDLEDFYPQMRRRQQRY